MKSSYKQSFLQKIFSLSRRLRVTVKPKQWLVKLAYTLANYQVPYPKKILALTFSINAAFKIRNDLTNQLPIIFATSEKISREVVKLVYATNYHGLCRRILKNYGYLINNYLSKINNLRGVGISIYDNDAYSNKKLIENSQDWGINLTKSEAELLIKFTKSVKNAGNETLRGEALKYIQGNYSQYLHIVKEKFLPKDYILFDSILLFTRQLF
jgi:DNA helicase II / ATP-dependent DNA helicase PcrA